MIKVTLRQGREKSIRRRHPWVFSGAIAATDGEPGFGDTVEIVSSAGERLGVGAWSPNSQIRVRVWSFGPDETIDAAFFRRRLAAAADVRKSLGRDQLGDACRAVFSESDGLPGVIIDRYGPWLVAQFLTSGAERWKREISEAALDIFGAVGVWERSDTSAREKEGLPPKNGLLLGEEPPESLDIREGDLVFPVDIRKGHKTGFYLDQRDNRQMVSAASAGAEVLNCFSYTGAFSAWALRGGAAKVTDIDSSAPALALAAETYRRAGFSADKIEQIEGDAFQVLRRFRDARRSFDLIVLDPPKFAETQGQLHRAARAYKDINLLAFKLIRPGGRLFTFSCSGAMEAELFRKVVADAALDANRRAWIVRELTQAADHPVALSVPESRYLKGLECLVS